MVLMYSEARASAKRDRITPYLCKRTPRARPVECPCIEQLQYVPGTLAGSNTDPTATYNTNKKRG